jgi:hypothetical protein
MTVKDKVTTNKITPITLPETTVAGGAWRFIWTSLSC